jgi:hypothetical protein
LRKTRHWLRSTLKNEENYTIIVAQLQITTIKVKKVKLSLFLICCGNRELYNMKMDVLEMGWGGVDWIGQSKDKDKWKALVNAVMNFWDL